MKIGIFDSGLGGLIILKEIIKKLPQYEYVYLGDSARVPYGNRSQETIYQFTQQAVDFLFKKNCQLIIVACNTASAEALRKIQQEWLPQNYPDRRVLGVIRPVVEKAVTVSHHKVGVIGTKATINSQSYIKEISKLNPNLKVVQQATPLLVPLIEEGWQKTAVMKKILRTYLQPLKLAKVDTLILGCTHYPILLKVIQGIMGNHTQVLNSGEIVADSLAEYLQRHSEITSQLTIIKNQPGPAETEVLAEKKKRIIGLKSANNFYFDWSKYANLQLFVTDYSPHYEQLVSNWFGQAIKFDKVSLS